MAVINPEIEMASRDSRRRLGRVPQHPGYSRPRSRARKIMVRAFDRSGKKIEMPAAGFTARVIQHETDHLDGILFFDRMKNFQSLTFSTSIARYWTGRKGD